MSGHYLFITFQNCSILSQLYIGRCVSELQADVSGAIEALDYYASLATTSVGHYFKLDDGDFAYVTKEPYGIVAGEAWFTYPF